MLTMMRMSTTIMKMTMLMSMTLILVYWTSSHLLALDGDDDDEAGDDDGEEDGDVAHCCAIFLGHLGIKILT